MSADSHEEIDGVEFEDLQEDSTRIIEKSKYLLGLTQTRIDHLKHELEQRRQEAGDAPAPSSEETERLLQEARERLAALRDRVGRSKDRDRERPPGRDGEPGKPPTPQGGL